MRAGRLRVGGVAGPVTSRRRRRSASWLDEHTRPWHEARVRLSRPRLLLRLALLLAVGGFALWRGWRGGSTLELLLGALALATAAGVGLALRGVPGRTEAAARPRRHTLHLDGVEPPPRLTPGPQGRPIEPGDRSPP